MTEVRFVRASWSRRIACVAFASALPALACSGGDVEFVDGNACRIDYPLLNGEPGVRYDLLYPAEDGRSLARTVYAEGGSEPTSAIFYYFDDAGALVIEALDSDLDGVIDARLDAGERLVDLITPYTVDAKIEDGNIDGVQFSVEAPSSRIGPWNPARIYFQTPCDQGDFVAEPEGPLAVDILLDQDDDGESDGGMAMQFSEDGRITLWTVDSSGDGTPDHVADVRYNQRGQVDEVRWTQTGQFFGTTYIVATYTYDAYGDLYAYELDAEADGVVDHRITYSSGCYPNSGGGQ